MTVYLVRHGDAGERDHWDGPDRRRPLDDVGIQQAHVLAELLGDRGVSRVLSSPYARCTQTVEPLAERLGLPVEEDDRLAEGADPGDTVGLIRALDGAAVLCTHGDNVPKVLDRLRRADGLRLPDEYDYDKGSIWVLDRDATGRFVGARNVPPPA